MFTPAELLRVAGLRPPLRAIVPALAADVEHATGKRVRIAPLGANRTSAQQAYLKANEATNPYPVAAPGNSRHEFGGAADLSIEGGTASDYATLATLARDKYGLDVGADFDRPDLPHVQLRETLDEARAAWATAQSVRLAGFTVAGVLVAGVVVALAFSNED